MNRSAYVLVLILLSCCESVPSDHRVNPTHSNNSQLHRTQRTHIHADPIKRLHSLLQNHPDIGLRTTFAQEILTGKISTAFGQQFALTLVPAEKIPGYDPTREPVPVLFVSLNNLVLGENAYLNLVLYHEYIHYRQWTELTLPADTFLLQQIQDKDELEVQCQKKWYAELEAYQKECEFAQSQGTAGRLPLCRHAQTSQFAQELLKELVGNDPSSIPCTHVWNREF